MTEREILLRRISTLDFAIVELNLYLDTHPYDEETTEKLSHYKHKSKILKKEFTEKFGPLSSRSQEKNRWAWISNPWPWDNNYHKENIKSNHDNNCTCGNFWEEK